MQGAPPASPDRGRNNQSMPAANPPMCANRATPPASVKPQIEASPLPSCGANQNPITGWAGNRATSTSKKTGMIVTSTVPGESRSQPSSAQAMAPLAPRVEPWPRRREHLRRSRSDAVGEMEGGEPEWPEAVSNVAERTQAEHVQDDVNLAPMQEHRREEGR